MFLYTPNKFFKVTYSLMMLLTISSCNSVSPPNASTDFPQPKTEIPAPAQMRAEVIVTGRVSTLKHIDIVNVGQQIPYTYSARKITNSTGFQWWVSKHFALKSDLPEEKIQLYLELLELSYPHYVALFGAEPPNIEQQRIAVIYGSSRTKTREAMLDDGFRRGVHDTAGGETMYYNRAGYSFPSSREQHQRYIVIHETMHAYHMALSGHSNWAPNWITEGLADSIAHHVYDPNNKQLTVMVFDRAPMNYVETGLKQYAELAQPSIDAINNNPALKRGLNFFIIHFLLDDAKRAQYFALFRDKLMALNPHSEQTLPTASKLLKEVFPEWQHLEQEFAQYVQNIRSSFHIASGPWEQDGNAYWIRSSNESQIARLDILLPNNRQTSNHPIFDFPAPAPSPLINIDGNNALGFGLLIDFQQEQIHRGKVGVGLGLSVHEDNVNFRKNFTGEAKNERDQYLSISLLQGDRIVFKGQNIEADYYAQALSSTLRLAMAKNLQLGISFGLDGASLVLDLKAGDAQQSIRYSLTAELTKQLVQGNISLLASDVSHRITPYLQDKRSYNKYNMSTAANPWHFKPIDKLQRVFRSCTAKPSISEFCQSTLQLAFANLTDLQQHGQIQKSLDKTEADIIEQLKQTANPSLAATISGISSTISYNQQQPYIRIINASEAKAETLAQLRWLDSQGQLIKQQSLTSFTSAPGINNLVIDQVEGADKIELSSQLKWQGLTLQQQQLASVKPYDGVYLSSQVQSEGTTLTLKAQLTGPYSGESAGKLHFEVLPSDAVLNSRHSEQISFKPYETVQKQHVFTLNPDYQGTIETRVQAEVDVDGESILLSQENKL